MEIETVMRLTALISGILGLMFFVVRVAINHYLSRKRTEAEIHLEKARHSRIDEFKQLTNARRNIVEKERQRRNRLEDRYGNPEGEIGGYLTNTKKKKNGPRIIENDGEEYEIVYDEDRRKLHDLDVPVPMDLDIEALITLHNQDILDLHELRDQVLGYEQDYKERLLDIAARRNEDLAIEQNGLKQRLAEINESFVEQRNNEDKDYQRYLLDAMPVYRNLATYLRMLGLEYRMHINQPGVPPMWLFDEHASFALHKAEFVSKDDHLYQAESDRIYNGQSVITHILGYGIDEDNVTDLMVGDRRAHVVLAVRSDRFADSISGTALLLDGDIIAFTNQRLTMNK